MPRKRAEQPWLHQASGFFCVTINGKCEYLDKDFDVACRKLKRLRRQAKRGSDPATRDWLDAPLLDLTNEFLDDIKARRAEGTYRNCREWLLRAMRIIGSDLRVGEVRRFHLSKIEQKLTGDYSTAVGQSKPTTATRQ